MLQTRLSTLLALCFCVFGSVAARRPTPRVVTYTETIEVTTTAIESVTATEASVCTPTLCPPLATDIIDLNFDDDPSLSTDYKADFPATYKSLEFGPGWQLLNGNSSRATDHERKGLFSPPYALFSEGFGMRRFSSNKFLFDLVEFRLLGWTPKNRPVPRTSLLTIRTDRMGEGSFPLSVPVLTDVVEYVMIGRAIGEPLEGLKWVELGLWENWRWWERNGDSGIPADGWTIDNLVVRKRRSCDEGEEEEY